MTNNHTYLKKLLLTSVLTISFLPHVKLFADDTNLLSNVEQTIETAKQLSSVDLSSNIKTVESLLNQHQIVESKLNESTQQKVNLSSKLDLLTKTLEEKQKSTESKKSEIEELTSKLKNLQSQLDQKRAAEEQAKIEAEQLAREQEQVQLNQSTSMQSSSQTTQSSTAEYSLSQFMSIGRLNWGGYQYTYYSQSVLSGGALSIPGRHVNADGYVVDGDGYIVLANDAPRGTIFPTPFGAPGKVYDRGTSGNHLDVYIR